MGKNSDNLKNAFSQFRSLCVILAISICGILVSCKKTKEVQLEEYTPLSKKVTELKKAANWSYEIENDRLSKKIKSFEAISNNVSLGPASLVALEGGRQMTGIFPELVGFTSLDTSNIHGEILDTINAFCKEMVDFSNASPGTGADDKKAESEKKDDEKKGVKDSSKIDALWSRGTLYSLALFLADSEDAGKFKSYIIGKPFVGDELVEVPVRWTCRDKILYTKIYPVEDNNNWKIQQIEIYKKEDGGKNAGK